MRIGIVTWYRSYNYGTCLQAYALKQYVKGKGFDCAIIDISWYMDPCELMDYVWLCNRVSDKIRVKLAKHGKANNEWDEDYSLKLFDDFVKENFTPVYIRTKADVKKVNSEFDYFITGSDQIWNPSVTKSGYLLKFVNDNQKKTIIFIQHWCFDITTVE